ncbi:MAG: sugar ABC transporter permease [Thermomicrobiales bacterium]|nr:sugar ABC transporter permease [Thermomicrobiales bacterium]
MQIARKASARGGRPGERPWEGYLYILPGFLIYAVFVLLPIVQTARLSFFDWTGFTPAVFIGLGNYRALLDDDLFWIALRNNLTLIVFYTIIPIAFALMLTGLLTRRPIRGLNAFRAGLFVPQVMSMVVVGVVWKWIYAPKGPLNQILDGIGLEGLTRPWLGNFQTALPAIGAIGSWVSYPFAMVLFIAGVQRIDEDLYDAAKLDGANGFQQFMSITLPELRNEITIALVTLLITALRTFDLVFVTTRGGPANRTHVVALEIYRNAFTLSRTGYAAAIAVVLTVVTLIVSYAVITLRLRTVAEG